MYAAQTVQREDMRRERRARALRKQREKRKMILLILLIVLTLVVIFVIGMGFGSMITTAKEPAAPAMYKYYANVEIQDGDTLWDPAGDYMDAAHYEDRMDYINEVMTINGMHDTCLIEGRKIILPYYSHELL